MPARKARGSDKLVAQLFSSASVTKKDLRAAVAAAPSLKIRRWWWFGQPSIDQIVATFDVVPAQLGRTVESLANLHSSRVQVGMEVFPNGMPFPEIMQVKVTLQRNLKNPG